MPEMIEISVIVPKNLKILIPLPLAEEFERLIEDKDLDSLIIEALSEELKKIRFRTALELATNKVRYI